MNLSARTSPGAGLQSAVPASFILTAPKELQSCDPAERQSPRQGSPYVVRFHIKLTKAWLQTPVRYETLCAGQNRVYVRLCAELEN